MLKKLDSFGLEACKDLEAAMEVVTEALMEAMEVTKAPARELGRAAAAKSTTVTVRIKCQSQLKNLVISLKWSSSFYYLFCFRSKLR